MSALFGTAHLTDACPTQTSPCLERCCDCQQSLKMEEKSPTPPLSRPGSSILTACDQDLATPPGFSPIAASKDRVFKTEEPHQFDIELPHAFDHAAPYPQTVEDDLNRYISIRDIQPSHYEITPPQFFQFPLVHTTSSYLNYQGHTYGPPSPPPTSISGSPAMERFPRTYIWPTQNEVLGPFDRRRDETYFTMSPEEEDDHVLCDKPYARLIYDALMQAPGHRMMLREIYDWFQCNTNKPHESGTNGWQNSIRHNLSMNQVSLHPGSCMICVLRSRLGFRK